MSNFFLSFFTSAYNYYSGRLAIVVRTDYPDIQDSAAWTQAECFTPASVMKYAANTAFKL